MYKTSDRHKFVYGIVVDNTDKTVLKPNCGYAFNFVGVLVFDLYTKNRMFIRLNELTQYDVDSIAGFNWLPDEKSFNIDYWVNDLGEYFNGNEIFGKAVLNSGFFDLPSNPVFYYSEYLEDISEYTKSSDYDFIFKPIEIDGFSRDKLLNSIVIFGTNEFGDTTNIGYDNLSLNDAFVYSPFKNKIKRYKVCKNGDYFVNLDTNKIVYGDKFKDKYFINRNPLKCKVFQDYYIRTNACDSSISDDYMKFGDKCVVTLEGKFSGDSSSGILSIPLDCKVVENLNIGVFSKYKESLLNIVIPLQIEKIRLENLKYNDILYISNKTNPSVIKNFVEFTMGDVDLSEYTAKLNSNNLKEILSILDDKVCWVVY